ncbi:hypothetical protein L596_002719 [Steinernema carpocapsae]|uniref:Rab-GAP TBC domain-containing protein n=1 Tax=Steinernema carpocapsae TaxID=34508 RepID=A0A4U8UQY6_STECR|nr:hypothetical protein L596_002719 [Steinernema carpocapsae]
MHDLFIDAPAVHDLPHREADAELRSKSILEQTLAEGDTTDALGFYLPTLNPFEAAVSKVERNHGSNWKRELSDQDWLMKWDSFLVNQANKPLVQSAELKALMRSGVPATYRTRIWKCLVQLWTRIKQDDTGHGYFECLLKKGEAQIKDDDACIKQIDLDLERTLPSNKFYDNKNSEKIEPLKRVLYAFRFHNKTIGYCQGLNRIAAISLLFLEESEAFWFMVAFVEYLQPADYYENNLVCAVADQKVLAEIMREKLPKLDAHLRKLEVDLTPFTLSWFLTCFVDVLPHHLYIPIFDIFLYEGNKILFRFAVAVLKLCEPKLLQCPSSGSVHGVLNNLAGTITDFKELSDAAFNWLNPFPLKMIETKRQIYIKEVSGSYRS